jgi:hypothetical protein
MSGGAAPAALPFARLVHCDWSVSPTKRWRADATRTGLGWMIEQPRPVGPLPGFVAELFDGPGPVLAGFDLPIGLPEIIGRRTGHAGFRDWLPWVGTPGPWQEFFFPNTDARSIRLSRPFFPDRWQPGMVAAQLTRALGVHGLDDLRRRCERAEPGRRAATPLFWTVGPAQVGKAAISGWRDMLQPALAQGAMLWPFDGPLAALIGGGRPVLAETYPGEAYRRVGIHFGPRQSKRRAEDRQLAAAEVASGGRARGIALAPELSAAVADGFAAFGAAGEDAFDAFAGLLGMIEVVDGRQPAMPSGEAGSAWEGWILGRGAVHSSDASC